MTRPVSEWPRLMKAKQACAYVSMSEPSFRREITAGRLPAPIRIGGADHWCRKALDASIDRLLGGHEPGDWRAEMMRTISAEHAA